MKRYLIGALALLVACADGRDVTTPAVEYAGNPLFNHVPGTTTAQHVVAVEIIGGTTARVIWHRDPKVPEPDYIVEAFAGTCSGTKVAGGGNIDGTAHPTLAGHRYADFPLSAGSYCTHVKSQGGSSATTAAWRTFMTAGFAIAAPNSPPSIAFSYSPADLDEGDAATFTITPADPDGNTVNVTYTLLSPGGATVASGTVTRTAAAYAFTFGYTFPDNGTYTLLLSVTDGTATVDNGDGADIEVHNVAPTATFDAQTPVNEGSAFVLSLTGALDPSSADVTAGLTLELDCGDGTWVAGASRSCPTTDNGTRTARGRISDKDGGANEYTATVEVVNVAPTATFNAPASVNEGSAITLSLTNPQDPSSADVDAGFSYAFDCGTGTSVSAGSSVSCPTTDNGSVTVRATIGDKDGGASEYFATVTVHNVAPTATFGAPSPVNEGDSFTLSLTDPVDPSPADVAAGFTYAFDCGDGAGWVAAASSSASCSTTDNGSRSVRGRIADKDGGATEYSASVEVRNVAPTAHYYAPVSVNEGSSVMVSLTNPSDPSSADVAAGFSYAFDCGSGYGAVSSANSTTCLAADDGVLTIRAKILDKDGGYTEYDGQVTVYNVAPALGAISMSIGAPISVGTAIRLSASFTDPGTDTWTCTIAWGDGPPLTFPSCDKSIEASRTYMAAGVYAVSVSVSDDDGGSDVRWYEYVVVYDPSAGFVTGGGWINSLPGMYRVDASLAGKATFGFVSKYQKGANTPSGNTEFQFHAAGLNFKSTSYQWLVVSGAKGTYKGEGTLNGVPGYNFLLSAIDGDVNGGGGSDKFRIKIWNGGGVVYDNLLGAAGDDADPSTVLGGGSIVIHAKK